MWISVATPATTSTITAVSASKRSATSTLKLPASIHGHSVHQSAPPGAIASRRANAITPTTKAAPITPAPTALTVPRPARRPKNRLKTTPIAGNSRISPRGKFSAIALPAHQVDFVRVDRLAVAENHQNDSQADGRLGCRHRHHEEDDRLPVDVAPGAAQRDEGQVDGVEHQLDRHEDDDYVAAQQNAEHADTEQNRAEPHKIAGRDHHGAPPGALPAVVRRASATAPTTPTSSSIEVTSKATR